MRHYLKTATAFVLILALVCALIPAVPASAVGIEQVGSLWLPEDLAPGEFRYLDMETWNRLRSEAGLGPWQEE